MPKLVWVALLGSGLLLLGKRSLQNVFWRITGIRIHKLGLQETTVIVEVEFNNASLLQYTIERPYFVINYQGRQLATVSYPNEKIVINPQSVLKLDLPVRLINGTFVIVLNDALADKESPLLCTVDGTIFMSGVPILKGTKQVPMRPLFDKYAASFTTVINFLRQLKLIKQ
jgi:hypothetical protein